MMGRDTARAKVVVVSVVEVTKVDDVARRLHGNRVSRKLQRRWRKLEMVIISLAIRFITN